MKKIRIIYQRNAGDFEKEVNQYLEKGGKVRATGFRESKLDAQLDYWYAIVEYDIASQKPTQSERK